MNVHAKFDVVWYKKVKVSLTVLFNVLSQRKPESLFPVKPMHGRCLYLPSTQSSLVLLETVAN